ncbi:MAG: ribosomal RNA small subunit methyltransferase A, partial [Candidatus Methylomirabilales bacterium]
MFTRSSVQTFQPPNVQLLWETRRLLAEHGIRPKKKLGQSFLIDARIRDLIVKAAEVGSHDLVVEIGAGTGTLTLALAGAAGGVLALEIDPRLFRILEERLKGKENVILFCGDALQFDFAAHLRDRRAKVVANLPYSA